MVPGFESEDDDEFSDDDLTKEKNNGSFLGVKSLGKVYNSGYSFLIILPILHILKNQIISSMNVFKMIDIHL